MLIIDLYLIQYILLKTQRYSIYQIIVDIFIISQHINIII